MKNLIKFYEDCYKLYGDNCKGVDWPNEEDAQTRYKIMLEVMKYHNENHAADGMTTLLDFGCGLGHMYEYIIQKKIDVIYTGLDMSELFIKRCQEKFKDVEFIQMDILKENGDVFPSYDYIVINGVFTEKREISFEEMFDIFRKTIKKLYNSCNCGMAFNVMSKDVDWEREYLFHLRLDLLSSFLTKEITRNFIIRYDYGLYEYCVYLYK